MTLRIERSAHETIIVFTFSGRIEGEHVEELERLFGSEPGLHNIVLNLKDLTLVDQNGVGFLARCEANGLELTNCPAYIREWIGRERGNERHQLDESGNETLAVNAMKIDQGGFDVKK